MTVIIVLTPIEYAVKENDAEILSMLLGAIPRSKANNFELYKNLLADALEAIPDFTMEMCFNCDSSLIPFVKTFAPSDVYKIYKRGDKLRVDLTLLGWTGTKGTRGNLSILFKGRGGSLLLVNHNKKTVETAFAELSEKSIEEGVEELLKEQKRPQKQVQGHQISLVPVLYRSKPTTQVIEGYPCTKYEAKYTLLYEKLSPSSASENYNKKYRTFEDYFADTVISFDFDRSSPKAPSGSLAEKKYKATVWVSNHYPLKYGQFAPLIHVLSYTSEHIAKFAEFFSEHRLENDGFPLKVCVPLFYTVNANITLKNLKFLDMDPEFMNVDAKYGGTKGYPRLVSSPEVKLYSPISRNHPKNIQSFAQTVGYNNSSQDPPLGEDNDRLRWTSYESEEENDESILRAKERFESLLNEDCENEVIGYDLNRDKDEEIVVEIVSNNDEVVEKPAISGENSIELNIADDDDETGLNTSRTATENIQLHSIKKVKTLKDVSLRPYTMRTAKSPDDKKKQKNEENLKKMQKGRKSRAKAIYPKQNPWDNIETLKKPFSCIVLKNPAHKAQGEERKQTKKDQAIELENAKAILEKSGVLKNVGRNGTARVTRNSTFTNYKGSESRIYKKTADVDISLTKRPI